MRLPAKNEPAWISIARDDVAATGSIAETARRIGIDRSALSGILNATPTCPYVNGKASTDKVAEKVMNTIGLIACPFLGEYHGEERRITGLQCREYAYRTTPPTSSPRDMRHWRVCQDCDKRVPAAAIAASETTKHAGKIAKVGTVNNEICTQQAGIIDKVTLPLPEVGGPQVNEEVA